MRDFLKVTAAAMVVSGGALLAAAPAYAGADEASRDSFWSHQSVAQPGAQSNGHYITVDPRDAKADANASAGVDSADASNPYFNHSMGTMSGPEAVAQSQAPTNSNGRYTATYQQPYMTVDPRDAKASAGASANVDADNPYFYHSMGTMGRP